KMEVVATREIRRHNLIYTLLICICLNIAKAQELKREGEGSVEPSICGDLSVEPSFKRRDKVS
uniref:hypothetical protein n=1 Tax=Thiolapillus sp. TaxID=2017437 RepID=UPI003AF7515D